LPASFPGLAIFLKPHPATITGGKNIYSNRRTLLF